jgi:hypothetical protein
MEPLDFLNGTSSLLLTSQKKLYHVIWTWKCTPKISQKVKKLRMNLIIKTNSIDKTNIWECSLHQYWRLGKNKQLFAKKFVYFQIFDIYFANCQKLKIQFKYLQVHWKNIIISIWLLKSMPTIVKNQSTQKNWYYFTNLFTCYTVYLETLNFCIMKLFFGLLYLAFRHGM